MNYRRYLIPLGSWAALILGLFYLGAYFVFGYQVNLAVALAGLSLSLSIKAYGNSVAGGAKRSSGKGDR